MPFATVKAIIPQKMNIARLEQEIKQELKREASESSSDFRKIVSGWHGDKPHFEGTVEIDGNNATVTVKPTGSTLGVNKFRWLDKGTRTRWAVMSGGWRSKTAPGKFSSGRGSGRVIIAGRRAMQRRNIKPRKGIKARNWTEGLQKRRGPRFTKRLLAASKRGVGRIYG